MVYSYHVGQRTPTDIAETVYFHESEWKCRTLLDAKENIPLENVLIVVDDLALPFGTLRLKGKGSDAGHNGLKHIAATLGTQNYARLRFGIGNDFPAADKWISFWDTLRTKTGKQWMNA